ncbi:hypothetical protein [Subtercola sp. YIM 133946]|uniref:hypothetical protein n=1 Tax=Subtercola sp. YIM 133946 TaxID=3118909 RepID=UPI002F924EA4
MTTPPPPPPRSRSARPGGYAAPGSPGGAPARFGSPAASVPGAGSGSQRGGRPRSLGGRGAGGGRDVASPVPLLIGAVAVALSAVIVIVTALNGRASSVWFLTLPIIEPGLWWLSVLGYLLTPLVVIVAFGLNRIWQRDGLRDRAFTPRPGYGLALKWMVGLSFLLALWHIVNLATVVSDLWVNP